jgi:hypothetical protein
MLLLYKKINYIYIKTIKMKKIFVTCLILVSCGGERTVDYLYEDETHEEVFTHAVEVLSDTINIDSIKNVFKQREELIIRQQQKIQNIEVETKVKDNQIKQVTKQLELEQTKIEKLHTIIKESVETDSIN